jgi:DNA-binding PadR family transcriptional regulator
MYRTRHQHRGPEFGRGHAGPFGRLDPRHERHHLRGRRGRVFEQGDLRYVILKLIGEKPSHGYELIKAIEERLGGAYSPSPGIIYPTLTLLEELGYVTAVPTEGARKAYEITAEGRSALEANQASVDAIFSRMDAVAERAGGGQTPQIVRAMENLRLALRLRLERGRASPELIARIAEILDGAAVAIEKD